MRKIDLSLRLERKFVFYLVVVAILTIVGPFGTYYALSFWDRLAFWAVDITVVSSFAHIATKTVCKLNNSPKGSDILCLVAGALLGAIPSTAAVIFIYKVFAPEAASILYFPKVWFEIGAVSIPMLYIEFALLPYLAQMRQDRVESASMPEAEQPPEDDLDRSAELDDTETPLDAVTSLTSPLADRLPPELRYAQIQSISMQDHYARITTNQGKAMLLMRMGDLVTLLRDVDGAQIHRSHWVAASEAVRIEKQGRKHVMHLRDGGTLPVSSNRLDQARALIERAQDAA